MCAPSMPNFFHFHGVFSCAKIVPNNRLAHPVDLPLILQKKMLDRIRRGRYRVTIGGVVDELHGQFISPKLHEITEIWTLDHCSLPRCATNLINQLFSVQSCSILSHFSICVACQIGKYIFSRKLFYIS